MARKNPGDSLRFTAGEWNRHEDAADDYARRATAIQGAGNREIISTGRIRIKNSSGADRRKGEILQVGDYLLTDVDRRYPWHDADLTDGSDKATAVLLEPIKDGDVGSAQIAGQCPALVNVGDAAHNYADAADGLDVLASRTYGRVQILWKPAGTGEKECTVLLGPKPVGAWTTWTIPSSASDTIGPGAVITRVSGGWDRIAASGRATQTFPSNDMSAALPIEEDGSYLVCYSGLTEVVGDVGTVTGDLYPIGLAIAASDTSTLGTSIGVFAADRYFRFNSSYGDVYKHYAMHLSFQVILNLSKDEFLQVYNAHGSQSIVVRYANLALTRVGPKGT